jgi:hypothetical protein
MTKKLFEVKWSYEKWGMYISQVTVVYAENATHAKNLVQEVYANKKDFFIHEILQSDLEIIYTFEEAPF